MLSPWPPPLQEPPSYPRISLLTSYRGALHRTSAKKREFPELLFVTFLLKQSRTNNRSGWSWKPARNSEKGNEAWEPLSTTCLATSQPPSPSHPNTNPWLGLSALCPPPSPFHTLLPLNRPVFPSPHVPSPSCLPPAFQPESRAQASSALCSSILGVHLLTRVLCAPLFSSPVSKAGWGSGSPSCAGMYSSKLCLIRCIGLCRGSYAEALIRLCIEGGCVCCCWHCPAPACLEVCAVHVPLLRSLRCD